ncbi:hypothetical protein FDZ71_12085, partial [bacterium]
WKLTPHARMLIDAEKNPDAILANDFNDDVPFGPRDIAYTVGSHWTQKYLTRIDGVLYVLPKFWNIPKNAWEKYSVFNWRAKPYNIACDGCHTVGFDPKNESFLEPGIGCESCHGPGKAHVESEGDISKIVNPLKLDEDRALMVCMQCHTDGTDTTYKKYPFPVNYVPGEDLNNYLSEFFMPKPKSNRWYWGTMDFMERRRMFYFFASKFYSTARACEVCGFDRADTTTKEVERYMSRSEMCGTCHTKLYKNYVAHSFHTPEKAQCVDCHTPEIVEERGTYSIHDHKFDFSTNKVECYQCHDKTDDGDRAVASIGADGAAVWKEKPKDHDFHFSPLYPPKEMTPKEACLSCHKEKDSAWVDKYVPSKIGFKFKN